jgi:diadenosine tetraphosphate (Ap4A) HIT family hydrolase
MAYYPTNVFARILRGELPCRKVYEDPHVLAFHDIGPHWVRPIFSRPNSDPTTLALLRAIQSCHCAKSAGKSDGIARHH